MNTFQESLAKYGVKFPNEFPLKLSDINDLSMFFNLTIYDNSVYLVILWYLNISKTNIPYSSN